MSRKWSRSTVRWTAGGVLALALLFVALDSVALNKTANWGFESAAEPGASWTVGGTLGGQVTATEGRVTSSTTTPQEGTYSLQASYSTGRAGRGFARTFTQTYTPTANVNAQLRGYYKRFFTSTAPTGYSVAITLKDAVGTVLATAASTTQATNDTTWQGGTWTTPVALTAGTPYTIELAVAGTLPALTSVAGAYFDNIQLQVSPQGLTPSVVAGTTQVSLSWSSTNGPNGPNLRASNPFQLYRGTASGAESALTLVPGTPYTDTSTAGNTTYWYQVTDFDSTNLESPRSVEASVLTLPGQPTMAAYGTVTQTSVVVNWTTPTGGAASYKIERSSTSGTGGFVEVASGITAAGANGTWTDSGPLTPGTPYWYRVRGTNTSGDGGYATATSVTTSASVAPTAPGSPAYASVTATGYTVTWAPSATGTTPITYTLQSSADGTSGWTPVTGCSGDGLLTCSVSSASNTRTYYRVYAQNGAGNATSGVTNQLTLPGQVTWAATPFTAIGQTSVTLNWNALTGNGTVTYTVDRAPDQSGSPGSFTQVATSLAGPSWTDSGPLSASTIYWYRIRGTNTAGAGADSASNSVTTSAAPVAPSAPGTPTYASVTATGYTVSWIASATGTTPITYTLQSSADGATGWAAVAGCSGDGLLTCSVSSASNTRTYYRVYAQNGAGNATSGVSSQLTLPGQVIWAATPFTAIGQTSVTLNWNALTGNGAVTYTVDRAPDSSGSPGPFAQVATSLSGTSWADSGPLSASTIYWYRIRGTNTAGTGADSASNSVTTAAAVPVAPSAPGTPTYASVTATGYTVNWAPSATGTTPITYTLQSSADGATGWAAVTGCSGSGLLTCSASSASNTRTYYRVYAQNGTGNATSGVSNQLTLPGQVAWAATPFTGIGQTSVTLNWVALTGNGTVTYTIDRAPDQSGSPGTFAQVATGRSGTSWTDAGPLSAATIYWYRIRGTNTAGDGANSASRSVTTSAAPVAPSAPGTPTYASVAAATLTASWGLSGTGSAPITYALQWSATGSAPWNAVSGCSGVDLATCNVSGLTGNTTYFYQVVATNSAGSATSGSSSQLTRPAQPAAPTYGTTGTASIVVNWAPPTGPTTGLTFNLDRAKDAAFTQELVQATGLTGTTATASSLTPGTTYYFRVAAVNAAGAGQPSAPSSHATQALVAGTTVGDGPIVDPTTVAPGSGASAVDAFTLQTSAGTDAVTSATVTLSSGTWARLSEVSIQNTAACTQVPPLGSAPPSSDAVAIPLAGVTATSSATTYYVCVTPKAHAAMPVPPGAEYAVTATVTSIACTNAPTSLDANSGTVTVDNKSPANVRWGAVTAADQQVVLNWLDPVDAADYAEVVILRSTAAIADVPAEGVTYAVDATIGASTVRYAGTDLTFTDTGLTNGTGYYYKAFAKDVNGNYAVGISAGPAYPGTSTLFVGSSDPERPVVSIINPGAGNVGTVLSGKFKVQVRVWSPSLAIQAVELSTDHGATFSATPLGATLAKSTNYGPTATAGVWEVELPATAGTYSIVGRARNDAATWVNSAPVRVTVAGAGAGDGRLLVRDDSSQLCSDCHAYKTHSSESVGTQKGAWSTVCRDCHTPHGTTNIYLVPTQITPPPRGADVPAAREVVFTSKTGLVDTGGSTTPTGVCQVCHKSTDVYKNDGTGASHYTGDCAGCHKHNDGLKASCTDCHGTKGRVANVAGADSNLASAPPDLAHDPQDPLKTPTAAGAVANGAHLGHVDKKSYRSAPLQCTACHLTNEHQDGNADVAWNSLATGNGTFSPSPATGPVGAAFSTTPTCTTWCHGNGLAGNGRNLTWSWTGTGPLACNSCHGQAAVAMPAQAAAHHPQNPTCANCHQIDYATGDKTNHIDGTVQHPTGCRACHGVLVNLGGTVAQNTDFAAAPGYTTGAVDTKGNTARTAVGVGAHVKHVNAGLMSAKCGECHTVPVNDDVAHANGAYGWSWSAIEGVTPSYTAPSCTNYCHSNARPLGQAAATTVPMAWTSTTALGCADCHKTSAGGAADLSARHGKHLGYGFTCDECHAPTMADNSSSAISAAGRADHVNGAKDVGFSTTALPVSIDQAGGGYAGYTCSSTYCHSDGTRMGAPFVAPVGTALSWNGGTTSTKCDNCHGGNASADFVLATGSHGAHVNEASYLGTNLGCAKCHANTVSDDRAIGTPANHVNGVHDVSAGGWNGTSTCSSNYCHSNGTEDLVVADYVPVTWGVTALANECKSCHGTDSGSVAGAPWYENVDTSYKTRNSHRKHVSSASDCVSCHDQTVTATGTIIADGSTRHLDGSRDVHNTAKIASYDEATETCSTVTCHGDASPQWGAGPMKCADCHVGTGDRNDWDIRNDVASRIDSGQWTGSGHGAASVGFAGANTCLYCHDDGVNHKIDGNPFRLRGASVDSTGVTVAYDALSATNGNDICINCHDVDAGARFGVDPDGATSGYGLEKATSKFVDAWHHGDDHGATLDGGKRCWDCHDPHGDGNLHMVGADVLPDSPDDYGLASAAARVAVSFTSDAAGGYTNATTPRSGVCQACHTSTTYWTSAGVGEDHNAGSDCVTCHSHQNAVKNKAFEGAGACSACHMGAASASSDTDRDEFPPVYSGGVIKSLVDPEDWYRTGHGRTSAYVQSNNPAANFPAPVQSPTIDPCYYCHAPDTALWASGEWSKHADIVAGTNPFRLLNTNAGANPNRVCLVCHESGSLGFDPDGDVLTTYGNINGQRKISATHAGLDHNATRDGGKLCWDCHDPHGDYNYAGAGTEIAYMVQAKPTIDSTDVWGSAGTYVTSVVDFTNGGNGFDATDYVKAGNNGVCQVCHTATKYWLSSGLGTNHMATGARCIACHAHQQGTTDAFKQTTACNGCHNSPPTVGRHAVHIEAIQATPVYGSVTNVPTAGAYGYQCGMCHTTAETNHYDDAGGTVADPYTTDVAFTWGSVLTYTPGANATTETNATSQLVFKGTDGSCTSVYCHDPQGTAYNSTPVTWTQAAGTLACTVCHDDAIGQTSTTLPPAHARHSLPTANGGYNYSCEKCHANTVNGSGSGSISNKAQHADNDKNDVKFNTSPLDQQTATFSGGTSGTCTNTYCHSNGQNRTGSFTSGASIAWNATADAQCDSCHGGNATATAVTGVGPMASNDHTAHMNQSAYLGTNFECAECHNATVAAGNDRAVPAASRGNHVNAVADVSMIHGGQYSGSATKQCSSTYCHSNGTETPMVAADYVTMDWDAGTNLGNDCLACHGRTGGAFTALYGEPNYTERVTTSDKVRNSHSKHVSRTDLPTAKGQCVVCHESTVDATGALKAAGTHLNQLVEITTGTGTKIASYTDSTETCTNITCHNAGTAQWGATLTCSNCHTSTTADKDNWSITDDVPSAILTSEWTSVGHGSAAVGFAGANTCLYCHDDTVSHSVANNPFRLRGASTSSTGVTGTYNAASAVNGNDICINCHDAESGTRYGVDPDGATTGYTLKKAATHFVDAWHYRDSTASGKHDATHDGGMRCWDCHDPHGDGTNLAMIGSDTLRDAADPYGLDGTRSTTAVVFTSSAAGGYANTTTRNGVCQVCHTLTKYWREASEPAPHNAGTNCADPTGGCHAHQQPPNSAFKGSGACTDCHTSATTNTPPRAGVYSDFARKSRHVSNGTTTNIVTDYDCILCHAEGDLSSSGSGAAAVIKTTGTLHGNDGGAKTVDLRNVDYTGTLPGTAGTAYWSWPGYRDTATTWSATVGQRDQMDTFCMTCHDSGGATGAAVNKTNPASGMLYSGTTLPGTTDAQKPFNVSDTLANNWDAAALNAVRTRVLNVRDQFNSTNKLGKQWASHHNLNQFTKRYTTNNNTALPTNVWQSHTLKDGQNIVPGGTPQVSGTGQGVTAGLHCSDCHLNEANAHGSANTPYMLGNWQGTDTAFGSHGTTSATGNCVMCHNRAVYGSSSTDSRFDHFDCSRFTFTTMSLMGGSGTSGADECLGCHGGGSPGRIHGTNETYAPLGSGTSRMYRFQGGGGTWRYYSPNNTANPTDTVGGNWDTTGTPNCYTISAADQYGGCTSHTTAKGGVAGQPTRRARPLEY